MSALPAWYWPASGNTARGVTIVPFGAGFAVPDWTSPRVWPFSGAFTAALTVASGTPGISAAVSDGSSGLWAVSYEGAFWQIASDGTVSASGMLPTGRIWVGCATVSGTPYFLGADGTVWNSGGSGIGAFGSAPAVAFESDGASLFTLLPTTSEVGTMSVPGGVTGAIALPAALAIPSCLISANIPFAAAHSAIQITAGTMSRVTGSVTRPGLTITARAPSTANVDGSTARHIEKAAITAEAAVQSNGSTSHSAETDIDMGTAVSAPGTQTGP